MKILRFDAGAYHHVRDLAALKPFNEWSLAGQLLALRQEINMNGPEVVLLTDEEQQAVTVAINALTMGIGSDRGLGRTLWLSDEIFDLVLRATHWEKRHIPSDGNATTPILQVKSWSIALRPVQ